MMRGAFLRRLASSKQTGEAASPISILGGRSRATSIETEEWFRMERTRASRWRLEKVRYTKPREESWVSIKGREELGQNVTKGIGVGAVPPPTPHVHEVVPKRMKTEGLNTIGNEPYVRKRLKEKGMLEGVN